MRFLPLLGACALLALESPTGLVAIPRPSDREGREPGGTAVVIGSDGTALTLAEALPTEALEFTVILNQGLRRTARVVARDPDTTAVLLRIQDLPANLAPLTLADGLQVQVGDPLWTAGNATGCIETDGFPALSLGRASARYEIARDAPPVRGRGGRVLSEYRGPVIETDAAINDGNEGGAVLDASGHLIGLASRGQARERRLPTVVELPRILNGLHLTPALAAPAGGGDSWRQALGRIAPALALVYLERLHGPGNPPGAPRPTRAPSSAVGPERERLQNWWDAYYHQQQIFYSDQAVSAVSVAPDLLLTAASNLHGEVERGRVLLGEGRSVAFTVRAIDAPLDLALLACEQPHGLPPVDLSAPSPGLGDEVAFAGRHSLLAGNSLTVGVVSALDRRRNQSRLGFLQCDARANYGNLGGPLIDKEGRMIGLCVLLGPRSDNPWLINSGVALTVDTARIRSALPELIAGRSRSEPPILGLGISWRPRSERMIVERTYPNTGAAAAGLQPGDEILRIADIRVTSNAAVTRALLRHKEGDRVSVELRRAGKELTVAVEIREFSP